MGNASTKERTSSPGDGGSGPSITGGGGGGAGSAVRRPGRSNGEPSGSSSSHPLGRLGALADGSPASDAGGYISRSARRHNFENAIFGLGGGGGGSGGGTSREARERDREAEKAAREARRKEREEERQRERERSRREESLDGAPSPSLCCARAH